MGIMGNRANERAVLSARQGLFIARYYLQLADVERGRLAEVCDPTTITFGSIWPAFEQERPDSLAAAALVYAAHLSSAAVRLATVDETLLEESAPYRDAASKVLKERRDVRDAYKNWCSRNPTDRLLEDPCDRSLGRARWESWLPYMIRDNTAHADSSKDAKNPNRPERIRFLGGKSLCVVDVLLNEHQVEVARDLRAVLEELKR